ncbi:bifunctional phosphoribosyl-AMP cyclohydrolase/phosphoribosyl-ATP diphosphatase HisIE [bacterium]|nr:bifunctional phosphoribosyl-AMP cyclohydrolase/phosphoribosyl-ATP diphosphatase HisIE [bacterium]
MKNCPTPDEIAQLDFGKGNGLLPAVVQHARTHQVLMVGFMNEEAVQKTLATEQVTFFSRTKNRLWTKGESSGNTVAVVALHIDCDNDTLLIRGEPKGPLCHTGSESCFSGDLLTDSRFLGKLSHIIDARVAEEVTQSEANSSYTQKLFHSGTKRCAQKVGEEGVEVALAAMSGDRRELVEESADLLFHLLVLLKKNGSSLEEIGALLSTRHDRLKMPND